MTLVAFANLARTSGGTITLPTTSNITTSGNGNGYNGNFWPAGQNNGGTTLTLGNITTSGGLSGFGNVELDAATPNTTPNPIIQQSNAQIIYGGFGGGTLTNANVTANSVTLNNANLTLSGNSVPTITTLTGSVNNYSISTNSTLTLTGNLAATTISLTSAQDITYDDGLTAQGRDYNFCRNKHPHGRSCHSAWRINRWWQAARSRIVIRRLLSPLYPQPRQRQRR